MKKLPLKERFLAKVTPEPYSGCWLWTHAVDKRGYGVLTVNNLIQRAHRVAYKLFKGDPGRFFVCHKCDTPPCVNPDHLFLGNAVDNTRDMIQKGRMPPRSKGEARFNHKITEQDVREIRMLRSLFEVPYLALARRFGINQKTVRNIVDRTHWRHVV